MKTRYFLGIVTGLLSVSAATKPDTLTTVPAVARNSNGTIQQSSAAHPVLIASGGTYLYITPKSATRARLMHAQTVHRADQNAKPKMPVIPNFPDSNTETATARPANNQNNYNNYVPPVYANNGFGAAVTTNSFGARPSAKTNVTETAQVEGPKVMPIHEASGPAYNDSDPLLGYQREQAEKGNPESQYAMGLRYLRGTGVEQSDVLARQWFEKASAGGNLNARAKLRELNAPLDLSKEPSSAQ